MSDGPDDEAITVRWIAVCVAFTLSTMVLGMASCERKTQALTLEARLACTEAGGSWLVVTGSTTSGQCLMMGQPSTEAVKKVDATPLKGTM